MDARNEHIAVVALHVGQYTFMPARADDADHFGLYAIPGQVPHHFVVPGGTRTITRYQQFYVSREWIRSLAKRMKKPMLASDEPQWK
jgi:hypothetical protein